LCEENIGLVYLLGTEHKEISKLGIPVAITSRDAQYIGRTPQGCCAAFDDANNACAIYENRPLCCRLYPLDLVSINDELWWVIHSQCPIAQRFFIERKLDILAAMTVAIEKTIGQELLRRWLNSDRMSQNIESFSSTSPRTMTLRRFGTRNFAIA
jgi:Fe-S-cluster containining protein